MKIRRDRAVAMLPAGNTQDRRGLSLDDGALLAECDVHTYRASGPGGQKRNKTSSAVRLHHRPSGLIGLAVESRSQHENRRKALTRLRACIALEIRLPVDPEGYRRSDVLDGCIGPDGALGVSRRDPRYLLVLGETLDVLAAHQARVRDAARTLGLSTSHLVSFLRRDRKAWARVNRLRASSGLKPLK